MEGHRDKVEPASGESQSDNVTTAVIRSFERDVRALLHHIDHDYQNPELALIVCRLRRVVGYDS